MAKQNETSIKKSVFINAMGKYSSVFFQLIFSAVLSRILTPTEFGVVTVINVFVVFFELFSDLGIGTAIIQNKSLNAQDIQSIFSFTCLLGIGLSLAFTLFSFFIANFYDNNVYIPLGMLFSISILLTSIDVVPNAILMRDKKFISVSIRTVVSCIVGYVVAIILAFAGFSFYALVIRAIITATFLLLWNLVFSRGAFRFTVNLKSVKKIWTYSTYQFGASFLNYFQRNLDNILVGKFMGEEALGYYNKSYTLMQYPISYLSHAITPVLHPILSDYQDQKEIIFLQYIRIVQALSLIGVLVAGIFISNASEIVCIMFGKQWELAVEPLRIISFCIWPQMISGTFGCVMQSLGNTKGMFIICCYTISVSIVGIVAGISTGSLTGLAYCIVMVYWLHLIIGFIALIKQGAMDVLRSKKIDLWIEFVMLVIMYMVAYLIYRVVAIQNLLLSLIVKCIIIVLAYVVMLIISKRHKILLKLIGK